MLAKNYCQTKPGESDLDQALTDNNPTSSIFAISQHSTDTHLAWIIS